MRRGKCKIVRDPPAIPYPDSKLVERAVRNALPRDPGKHVRLAAVSEAFGCGSTVADALCRRYGLNPNDVLDGPSCDACVAAHADEEEE